MNRLKLSRLVLDLTCAACCVGLVVAVCRQHPIACVLMAGALWLLARVRNEL